MKKVLLTALAALYLLTGCGGGGSAKYTENKALGKLPSIYMVWHELDEKNEENMRKELEKAKTEGDFIKINEKYIAFEEKRKQETIDAASKEIEKLRGKDVPYSINYDDPDFEIVSATIEEIEPSTGALSINLKIKAKRDLDANINSVLHYVILSNEDSNGVSTMLFKGTINPFFNIQIITGSRFPGGSFRAGELCNEDGSKLMLYCNSYDFTNFKQIFFVTPEDFRNMR